MDYRQLGPTIDSVSAVGVSCGGIKVHDPGAGPADSNETIAAIHLAAELGVSLIDIPPTTAAPAALELVGKALSGVGREMLVSVSIEVPRADRPTTAIRSRMLDALAAVQRRLRRSRVDLLTVHFPETDAPIAELMDALAALHQRGDVAAVGLSNIDCQRLAEARRHGPVHAVRCEVSLLERSAIENVLPYCLEHRIGVLGYDPLCRGLLSGRYNDYRALEEIGAGGPEFRGYRARLNIDTVRQLKAVAEERHKSLIQLALSYVIDRPGLSALAVELARPTQVREVVAAALVRLTPDEFARVDQILDARARQLEQ